MAQSRSAMMLGILRLSVGRCHLPIGCRSLSAAFCHTRSFSASARLSDDIDEPPKAKPKATTPLRRSASASLPIRETRTPTRGAIQTVFTLATAERYLLSRIRQHPNLPIRAQTLNESVWIPKWGQVGQEGEVFIFSNGSFVCWGLREAEARRFAAEVIDLVPGIKVAPLAEAETEELEFVVDPIELGGA